MSKEFDELQEIARQATYEALKGYTFPDEWRENVYLETLFEGDDRIFELCTTGENPADRIVISSARVNRKTKSVQVTIPNLKL
jgi:hypothetical protein